MLRRVFAPLAAFLTVASVAPAQPVTLKLWPGTPPGDETVKLPPETDQTKPQDKLIAGRRIIKLGNVSTPLIDVYPAPKDKANGAAIVICPGGGHRILAYDLEGTEVAEWLASLGVTGIVLKYRVPSRTPEDRVRAALQDAQRALSLTRSHAAEWGIDPRRVGILGFSAGGETAAMAALAFAERKYVAVDAADQASCRPDFALLIYPGGLYDAKKGQLHPQVVVPTDAPPMFFVHAADDGVPVQNSLLLAAALKDKKVPVGLHVYPTGGHGYGLRPTPEPVTQWPAQAEIWLRHGGFLRPGNGRHATDSR